MDTVKRALGLRSTQESNDCGAPHCFASAVTDLGKLMTAQGTNSCSVFVLVGPAICKRCLLPSVILQHVLLRGHILHPSWQPSCDGDLPELSA
jgi:hypothetical protein